MDSFDEKTNPDGKQPDAVREVGASSSRGYATPRIEPRVSASFAVNYESVNELVTAYTADVSRGGIYVETTQFLPVGAVVRINVTLPNGGPELQAVARVAYILDEEDAKDHENNAGMGMEFLDVGGAPLADEIARYLAQHHPAVELPPSPAGMSSRILIVDDEVWHRERAAEVMREAGHEVITAENGVKALGIAMKDQPDLILTDVQMPKMDGWQLVRMLRTRPTLAQIPVIFVTSLGSDEQRLQGYRLGVDDYLAKPFNNEELALRVHRVLTRARAYPRNIMGNKVLRGDMAHVSLANLLAFLEVERREGLLLLVRKSDIATLYLREGRVVRVDLQGEADELKGPERVHHVLDWDSGRFELADANVEDEDTIGASTSAVLLEHARRLDETNR